METIVFFIPNLGKGGAERILVNVANRIANGFSDRYVVKIALAKKEGFYLEQVDHKIEIVDFKSKQVSGSLFKLIKYIRSFKGKKVHLFSFLGYANIIAILAAYLSCNRKSIDLIVSERNHIPWDKDWRSRIVYLFQIILYKRCDAVVTIADSISEEIANQLHVEKKRIYTIYNPITRSEDNSVGELSAEFISDELNIIVAGRLIPVKDFPLLLKAVALIKEKQKTRLWDLGEGPERDNLEKLAIELGIENCVNFCGFVNNTIAYFSKADVYVCSSLSEGFGNVVLEAMEAGTRIVSMSCGGPDEILENGKWGTIVYNRTAQELAKAIIDITEKPVLDYSKRLSDFEINNIVRQYLSVLK